jgi:hypothetical protein
MSQSGALDMALLDAATHRGLGVSTFVSVGNKADVSSNDLLLYWEQDEATDVAALYIDSFGNPPKFGRVARRKPVIVIKPGRGAPGPVPTHHAAALDRAATEDALFTQAGVLRVNSVPELLAVADVLLSQPLPLGRRVAVVSNSRSVGVLAGDACITAGLEVTTLAAATQQALQSGALDNTIVANPVDLTATSGRRVVDQQVTVLGQHLPGQRPLPRHQRAPQVRAAHPVGGRDEQRLGLVRQRHQNGGQGGVGHLPGPGRNQRQRVALPRHSSSTTSAETSSQRWRRCAASCSRTLSIAAPAATASAPSNSSSSAPNHPSVAFSVRYNSSRAICAAVTAGETGCADTDRRDASSV